MQYSLSQEHLEAIESILNNDFTDLGVHCVVLVDMAGNIIANFDNGEMTWDIYSLAALAAGNYGAVSAMAKIIGEEEFSLLFHKGERESIHFSKVMEHFILISVFGPETSLGFLRLKAADASEKISKILGPSQEWESAAS